ncbi:MAG: RNA-binding transcriptional accessory protein [Clostridia bacterium]|nr:RNA-binding transcriptional accessory protein [Clostridia bacterium]
MNIIGKIATELNIRENQVEKTVELIDEGNTIPFIARYRKEVTGNLSDETLRDLNDRLTYLRNLEKRKEEVKNSIENQGKLTEEIVAELEKAETLAEVEDIYRPYKQKKKTRGTTAKAKGLEELANNILEQSNDVPIYEEAKKYIKIEEVEDALKVETPEDALSGAKDIIAEQISDDTEFRRMIKKIYYREGIVETTATNPEEKSTYNMYYSFGEKISTIPSHRILAINRGEKEEFLKVKITKPEEKILYNLAKKTIKDYKYTNNLNMDMKVDEISSYISREDLLFQAIKDGWKRLIEPSVDREIRNDLTEKADEKAIKVFGKNAKQLLLGAPLKGLTVLGFDPAYRTGCKLATIDETGKVLGTGVIYPTEPQNDIEGSKKTLFKMFDEYNIDMVAIGNGTASRESEQFVSDTIKEYKEKKGKEIYYVIVSEAGASVYSASKLATEEYPDLNVSIRGAISIARRLQDPLAEFVKIDPKAIGIGQYQHDVNQKKLSESLTNVVEDAVNEVGVDVNTATPSLLSYVSGINSGIAKNIVKYREENGKFTERKQLLKVPKLGKVAFEQCSGFMRVPEGKNPLEITAVHPESYDATEKLINKLGYKKEDLLDKEKIVNMRNDLAKLDVKKTAQELEIGDITLEDIIKELSKPGRDVRDEMPKPVFRSDVLKFEDLQIGQELTGTVRNITDFGAFVDVGVKHDGLVHISEMSDKYVRNPSEIVSIGDVVKVKVIDIDQERQKVKLSMK